MGPRKTVAKPASRARTEVDKNTALECIQRTCPQKSSNTEHSDKKMTLFSVRNFKMFLELPDHAKSIPMHNSST